MQDIYVYSAIFEHCEEGGYYIEFPDFEGCFTDGEDLQQALYMARERLEIELFDYEEEGKNVPIATRPEDITVKQGQFVTPVTANMDLFRNQMNNRAVKKTLTIPYWMNKVAEERKINFSALLQEAIKNTTGIREYR